jgi:hypothetical protein
MTIQQTIDVPADRRVYFDLPRDIPVGAAKIEFTIIPFRAPRFEDTLQPKKFDPVKAKAAHERMCGMFETDGHEVDRFMAEKTAEKALEI